MTARGMTAALALAALVLALRAPPVGAVNPDEVLADPALENRAREISKELRCLVCQNQSIDDSDAPLARDLRIIVRERLREGDSDDAVVDFVVARYGEFVLLRPRFRGATLILWLGPAMIAVLGLVAIVLFFRRRAVSAGAPAPLSDSEKRRLQDLLDGNGPGDAPGDGPGDAPGDAPGDGPGKHGGDSP